MSDAIVRPDTPLGYAQSACDTMMRRYAAADLRRKDTSTIIRACSSPVSTKLTSSAATKPIFLI